MRYNITVKYNNKEVTVKVQKDLEGTWDLKDFLKYFREKNNLDYSYIMLKTDVPKTRLIAMEKGEIDITDEYLRPLQKLYKFPQKILCLTDNKSKPIWAIRLLELRTDNYYTQEKVSKELGITQATYAGYESGKHQPDLETFIKLADLYKISLDYLTGRLK